MTKAPVNLFSPLSTYNIFLSFAIATTETAGEENILVLPDYNEANEACLGYLSGRIPAFREVVRLVKGTARETFLHRPFRKREVFRGFDGLFSRFPVARFFCFNDLKFHTQYALAALKKAQPEAACIYVEDGTGDYCELNLRKKSLPRKLRNRFFYSDWWRELDDYGTHPLFDGHRFIFPGFAKRRALLETGRVRQILPGGVSSLPYGEDAERRFGNLDRQAIEERDSIALFVDPANYMERHPGHFGIIARLCEEAIASGMNVLFKGKDRNVYPKTGFEGHPRFFTMPAAAPSELLLLWFGKGIRRIVGGKSSALMTSRWLAPEIPCCTIGSFISEEDSRLGSLFRSIGIEPCGEGVLP